MLSELWRWEHGAKLDTTITLQNYSVNGDVFWLLGTICFQYNL